MKHSNRFVVVLSLATLALLAGVPSQTPQAAPSRAGCDELSMFATAFQPVGFALDHVNSQLQGPVDATNRAAWIDQIFVNSAFLDTVPAGGFTVAEFILNRPEVDMTAYRAWLETVVMDGDEVCALQWTLHGTAAGDTTFTTYGLSRGGVAVFEPLMYFHLQTGAPKGAGKESGGDSGSVVNGFGMTMATWNINVAIQCNNCRIIDPAPYTTVSTWAGFLYEVKYDVIESTYFQPAPCCPDDKVECVKSVVKIAVTSGGKTAVTIKHDDWIEVKFEGWFGCTAQYPYTFHVCCTKLATTKTVDAGGTPTRTFRPGEEVGVAGDNLPPNSVVSVAVFPNLPMLNPGMPIPMSVPGAASRLYINGAGEVQSTDIGGGRPVLMPGYIPMPGPTYDVGYDYIVDTNENGIWDEEEPALDVREAAGFSSNPSSAVPGALAYLELRGQPNPFNPRTTIDYSIGLPGDLAVKIHDVRGRLVRTLFDGRAAEANGSLVWDGTDDLGKRVVSGVYFVRALAHGRSEVLKLAIIK